MAKLKNVLLMALSFALVAALAIGGTVAYLTDTDGDVNVMTLGNVDIQQLEYERVEKDGEWVAGTTADKYGYYPDELQEYTQAKPLYPAVYQDGKAKWDDRNGSQAASGEGSHQQSWAQVGASGSNQLFDSSVKNVQDKFVFVKNTGKSSAYVRTVFAFEAGNMTVEDLKNDKMIHLNVNFDHWSWEWVDEKVEIDEVEYIIVCATYKGPASNPTGILAAGAVSYPSLLQVYLDPTATNDDCEAFGATYDILTFSQAVQTAGFDDAETALAAAFGEITTENHPWTNGVKIPVAVATADELSAALEAGNSVYLTADISDNRSFVVAENADVTIYMNGHTLTSLDGGAGNNYAIKISKGASLTLKGDGKIVASCYGVNVSEDAKFTMNSGEIVVRGNGTYDFGVCVYNGGTFVMNGGEITASVDVYASFYTGFTSTKQPTVIINDGDLIREEEDIDLYAPAYILTNCTPKVTINGGTFDGVEFSGNVSDYFDVDAE